MVFIKNKNNKILIWLLAIVLAGVWGEVGYRLIRGGNSGGEDLPHGSSDLSTQTNRDEVAYNFMTDVRDPFSYRPEAPVIKRAVKPALHIWVPPPLRLEGVLIKPHKRTAIVESLDGNTFFVSQGDTLYGVKFLSIDNDKVLFRYEKKDTSWAVAR